MGCWTSSLDADPETKIGFRKRKNNAHTSLESSATHFRYILFVWMAGRNVTEVLAQLKVTTELLRTWM